MKTPENILSSNRKWKEKNKDRVSQYDKEWKKNNPEKVKLNAKRYYQKNKLRLLEYKKRKKKENPEYYRMKSREYYHKYKSTPWYKYKRYKRSARLRGYSFNLTFQEFARLIESECSYCSSRKSVGVDRKDNGVGYELENCVSCCSKCNYFKGAQSYDEFISTAQHYASILENLSKN